MDKKTLLNELNKIFIDDIAEKIVDKVIFTPKTNEELQIAVKLWCKDRIEGEKKYGIIGNWDVSLITDIENLFANCCNFNDDISNWDVSNVKNMIGMFYDAKLFNQDLSLWDVSNVKDMSGMFKGAD